ncbi:MAG TPA: CTP synthase [Nitrososphaeraceae archaeon]|nr:CTP synthase [Nitrososphaeraceae archaeon]
MQSRKTDFRSDRPKYIFVTGGVMSGLGKGVISASTAKLLQLTGLKVSCVKIDPYVNYDAGTMNPMAHGEVFVTKDGGECDMDLGNYERFLDVALTREHNITTGRVYLEVIQLERNGKYLGQCVQIIPHITDNIKDRVRKIVQDEKLDVVVVECGGTVGDIESQPFLEAFRQIELEEGGLNTLYIHVTLAPVLDVVGEQKTKPTQHSVQELRRIGIQPDILAVRCKKPLAAETRRKISLFASVNERSVISCYDVASIYQVPEILEEQGMLSAISEKIGLRSNKPRWSKWKQISKSSYNFDSVGLKIAAIGKYVSLPDSYVSVYHALWHAGAHIGSKIDVKWIDSEKFENSSGKSKLRYFDRFNGIIAPGGFGKRGSEGIINIANYARIKKIPYLGICFGFQLAIVAFVRNVCMLEDANSTELDPDTEHPVVKYMPEQNKKKEMGGSMRLGEHEIEIIEGSNARRLYGSRIIYRRHRHRFEFNQDYRQKMEDLGMIPSAHSDRGLRTETVEIPKHPFYFGVQYHSEFHSRPGRPEESFGAFVKAASFRS